MNKYREFLRKDIKSVNKLDVENGRSKRLSQLKSKRMEARINTIQNARKLQTTETPKDRKIKFEAWKAERQRLKQEADKVRKPAFVTGVVRRPICSPVFKQVSQMSAPRTRSAVKRNILEGSAGKGKKESHKKKTSPSNVIKLKPTSFAPVSHNFTVPSLVRKLDSLYPAEPEKVCEGNIPENFSSWPVTTVRKTNLPIFKTPDRKSVNLLTSENITPLSSKKRKSVKSELKLQNEGECQIKNVQEYINRSLNFDNPVTTDSSVKEEVGDRGPEYFRKLLNDTISRLESKCMEWIDIKESVPDLPVPVNDLIDGVCGMTKLLISSKFEQFRNLIIDSMSGKSGMKLLNSDLEGFWDMVYLQVEGLDEKFAKLDKIKKSKWKLYETPVKKLVSKVQKRKNVQVGHSKFRDFLKSKKMTEEQSASKTRTPSKRKSCSQVPEDSEVTCTTPITKEKRKSDISGRTPTSQVKKTVICEASKPNICSDELKPSEFLDNATPLKSSPLVSMQQDKENNLSSKSRRSKNFLSLSEAAVLPSSRKKSILKSSNKSIMNNSVISPVSETKPLLRSTRKVHFEGILSSPLALQLPATPHPQRNSESESLYSATVTSSDDIDSSFTLNSPVKRRRSSRLSSRMK